MGRVEDTYVKHFANGNRRKGLKTLRPQAKRERHRITFLYGKEFCDILSFFPEQIVYIVVDFSGYISYRLYQFINLCLHHLHLQVSSLVAPLHY